MSASEAGRVLRESEAKLRSVLESAIDAIISADAAGTIVGWNGSATRMLGYTAEEALGESVELIIPARFREAHRTGMARVAATGNGHVLGRTVEVAARARSGEDIPIELSLSTWTVGEERHFTGILRDISRRKRAEEALRSSERALRAKTRQLEKQNEVLEGTLKQLSEAHDRLLVQEKMASLGRLSAGLAHELNNPASAAQRGAAQLGPALDRLSGIERRLGALGLDGSQEETLTDLDRRAAQHAREPVVLGALERSDREVALESWLAAHGVAEPWRLAPALVRVGQGSSGLGSVLQTFSRDQHEAVLEWLGVKAEIHDVRAEIDLGTERIAEVVAALKSYTHLGQAPVQAVDVREGLDDTLLIVQSKLKRGVTVRREYADDVPILQAYAGALNQVWTNLIDNAVDAMEGRGTLTLRVRHEAPWIVVEVEDDGPGIPDDIQKDVFDPFFTTKAPGQGTGLGLNISRNIVHEHGGLIEVTSRSGETRFVVCLPNGADRADRETKKGGGSWPHPSSC